MTEALATAIETATAEVAAITDPIERYYAARKCRATLASGDRELKDLQQDIANHLKAGRTWAEVGELLGVTGSRAEALAKGR